MHPDKRTLIIARANLSATTSHLSPSGAFQYTYHGLTFVFYSFCFNFGETCMVHVLTWRGTSKTCVTYSTFNGCMVVL